MLMLYGDLENFNERQRSWLIVNGVLIFIGALLGHSVWTCWIALLIGVPLTVAAAELKGRVMVKWQLEDW